MAGPSIFRLLHANIRLTRGTDIPTISRATGISGKDPKQEMPRTITHAALAPLKSRFSNLKLQVGEFRDMVTVVVPRENIREVAQFLRDDPALRYDMLAELNGVDYLNFPGAQHRFAVNYGLTSIPNNNRLWLKVFLNPTMDTSPKTAPLDENILEQRDPGLKVESVTSDWSGAESRD